MTLDEYAKLPCCMCTEQLEGRHGLEGYVRDQLYFYERMPALKDGKPYVRIYHNTHYYETCSPSVFAQYFQPLTDAETVFWIQQREARKRAKDPAPLPSVYPQLTESIEAIRTKAIDAIIACAAYYGTDGVLDLRPYSGGVSLNADQQQVAQVGAGGFIWLNTSGLIDNDENDGAYDDVSLDDLMDLLWGIEDLMRKAPQPNIPDSTTSA